ncbi:phosphoribosylformylglycinamidine synthase subunit PurS [Rubricoccus marinus]|uniref:Phosphoribosylformylglycinamidine synthase subunit PurS n=1 Tax=Rubricoccus marinus TaxID=716817 RepID=A0A259TY91_9BACT|nr:phosphoribosylformylglycinamidine synthase subunit PurS [Rubricoccus marinus]OZC02745.1 phosphoribosylformylglycinamidine synthase [Rubricoccus marinus]
MYRATVHVTLRPSILDPQGKAIQSALDSLGQTAIESVRTGKRFVLTINADSEQEAREAATKACETLLANAVMEDFEVESVHALELVA